MSSREQMKIFTLYSINQKIPSKKPGILIIDCVAKTVLNEREIGFQYLCHSIK